MQIAIVIPARMASTRFPGKPLVQLAGKPMIQWVYEAALAAEIAEHVLVATPDPEIMEACARFGARAEMTRMDHPSGTDRIAEIAERVVVDAYVNVQGDEPLVPAQSIRECAQPLLDDPSVHMATLFEECAPDDEDNPAVVKLVTTLAGDALYFSRHAIPYPRSRIAALKRHVGMYAYTRPVLQRFQTWSPSPLELCEGLEQLRFLENGIPIRAALTTGRSIGVDTPQQAEQVAAILAGRLTGS